MRAKWRVVENLMNPGLWTSTVHHFAAPSSFISSFFIVYDAGMTSEHPRLGEKRTSVPLLSTRKATADSEKVASAEELLAISPIQLHAIMAFVSSTAFIPKSPHFALSNSVCTTRQIRIARSVRMEVPQGGKGKKPSRSRKFRPGAGSGAQVQKTKLEPETVFIETGPSNLELVVPTLSILTVIGIIPFVAAVSRAAWVRYKFTSRRISISSGFQGKDQTEVIYRDIDMVKYVRRLGGAADCVLTLRDGAKLELRAVPEFDKIFEYLMEKVSDETKEASGPA